MLSLDFQEADESKAFNFKDLLALSELASYIDITVGDLVIEGSAALGSPLALSIDPVEVLGVKFFLEWILVLLLDGH